MILHCRKMHYIQGTSSFQLHSFEEINEWKERKKKKKKNKIDKNNLSFPFSSAHTHKFQWNGRWRIKEAKFSCSRDGKKMGKQESKQHSYQNWLNESSLIKSFPQPNKKLKSHFIKIREFPVLKCHNYSLSFSVYLHLSQLYVCKNNKWELL